MASDDFSVFSELLSNKTTEYNNLIWDYCSTLINQCTSFNFSENIYIANYHSWIWAMVGSIVVGMSGIFPLLVIPIDETATLKDGAGAKTLRLLLSFAVGGLLGDVFLHLLPEAWGNQYSSKTDLNSKFSSHPSLACGLWVLAGLLVFIIIEKIFSFEKEEMENSETTNDATDQTASSKTTTKSMPMRRKRSSFILNDLTCEKDKVCYMKVLKSQSKNNAGDLSSEETVETKQPNGNILSDLTENRSGAAPTLNKASGSTVQISGYLNLVANSIDNFTHGLAVGGSFLLSTRIGLLTTFAILVHEIPHEVGDFAILLRAGFSRWDAAWAQVYTASAGIVGALTALVFSASSNAIEARTSWILPFTAGGFLHIALVTVLPELLEEKNPRESFKQMCSLASGITVMALLTALVEH